MTRFDNLKMLAAIMLSLILFGCGGAEDGDLTPPNFTFDGGVPSITASPGPHTFSGTTDLDAEIDVSVSFPTTGTIPTFTTPNILADGTWSFVVDNLVEGSNSFAVDVADPLGNSTVYFVTIFLDLTGPVVTLNQYATPTADSTQTLAGTVAELDATVEISIDGSPFTSVDDVNGGIWSHNVNLASAPGTPYLVEIRGVDKLLNPTDPADYATVSIEVDAGGDVFTISEDDAGPVYLDPPDVTSTLTLNGTRTSGFSVGIVSIIPVSTLSIDDISDPIAWTADFTDLPGGITEATFGLNDLTPVEVAQAKVMVVRDLSGPQIIDTVPVHGDKTFIAGNAIEITFSETMDPIINDGTIFELQAEDGTIIPFSSNPTTGDFRTFVFSPDPLPAPQMQAGLEYSVIFLNSVAATIVDEFGNDFIRPSGTWVFETQ